MQVGESEKNFCLREVVEGISSNREYVLIA